MAVLTTQQRNILETAVNTARKAAEAGAFNALHSLAVDSIEPFEHMSPEQRNLQNILWEKALLLGDKTDKTGKRYIERIVYELAYETWHKMLFAKFLETNGLLIHSQGVAVSMEDCEELAQDEGYANKWDAAANYASKMLPAIFRKNDPLMQVRFSTDDRIKLEEIIDSLENEIFIADDSLGWVYQFWQSEAKAAINASGDKIDGERLPAVTQLFTEPYMVHFLIDNTLGAWWVGRNPGIRPPVNFEYLRLLEDGTPAAGKFEGWPDKTAEITSLDPCMGSGHFITSLFLVFVRLRMEEEGLTKEEATDKVIAENLHGLELDARCTQIAAFNLALTAWKFCGHYKELPEMNLACSGIAPKGKMEDWVKLVENVPRDDRGRFENGMRMLYKHFQLAPELGSLLDPSTIKADALTASFEELQPILKKALDNESDSEKLERGVMAAGIAKSGYLLSKSYYIVVTNSPFLKRGKQGEIIKEYCGRNYPLSKDELATVFLERCLRLLNIDGMLSFVMPQYWTFHKRSLSLRNNILNYASINLCILLGTNAFETISGEVVNVGLFSIKNTNPNDDSIINGLDLTNVNNPQEKNIGLLKEKVISINQKHQLLNPDYRIILGTSSIGGLLNLFAITAGGLQTFDKPGFIMNFWEIPSLNFGWIYLQSTIDKSMLYGGRDSILLWQNGIGRLKEYMDLLSENGYNSGVWRAGCQVWGRKGVLFKLMGHRLEATLYTGQAFENTTGVVIPVEDEYLSAIWCYCLSDEYSIEIRKIDKKLAVTNSTLNKVPFDLEYWQKVSEEKYPNGLPKPYSDDPTQWLFHGHPIISVNPLQVSVGRLLGYLWPAESDEGMELADEARKLIEDAKAFDHLTDDDGIFCIPSVNAETAGADRLREYLQEVFAGEWNNQTITELLEKEDASSTNLEDWLRKEFFIQHCKVFQNRPFIWHIWDGRSDGFSALVNYHKLDRENLSKLIYTYLGDWIRMCEAKKKANESGAEGLLSAALKLKTKLENILQGEAPFDIFVRWKPLEQQPIGWEPDLNDGVRINIRPFIEADVLRKKPNIKWGIDRGKNPPGSYWGEKRDNDRHLTLEEKRTARERIKN